MKPRFEFKQGSDEWREARLGKPTASEFGRIISPSMGEPAWTCISTTGETCETRHKTLDSANKCCKTASKKNPEIGWKPEPSPIELATGAEVYMAELVMERLTGGPEDVQPFFNSSMERGNIMEPRARDYYEYKTGYVIREVGLIESDCGRFACSPDALVYPDNDPKSLPIGGLECKGPKASIQLLRSLKGVVPMEHRCQVHGGLAISRLQWWDYINLNFQLPNPAFIVRVEPNDFTKAISNALEEFDSKLNEMLAKIKDRA